jgi:hypothetical protein
MCVRYGLRGREGGADGLCAPLLLFLFPTRLDPPADRRTSTFNRAHLYREYYFFPTIDSLRPLSSIALLRLTPTLPRGPFLALTHDQEPRS